MENKKTYYCENCGGVMEFNIDTQNLKCPNCGTQKKVEIENKEVEEHELTEKAMKSIKVEQKTSTSMECEGCGALVEVDATSTATECPYCGCNYTVSEKQIEGIVPDGVVPFKIKKEDVEQIFVNWINNIKMAPDVLKNLYQGDKIQGIYMPFWTFDANVTAKYTAIAGTRKRVVTKDKEGNEKVETKIDWKKVSGEVNKSFDDTIIRASDKLKENLLNSLSYNTKDIPPYSPDYMSGYCAEIYTVSLQDANKLAKNKMKNKVSGMCRDKIKDKYDEVKDLDIDVSYKDETYKYILLPVYSTVYRFQDKEYHVLINGQSGKIIGEYPTDSSKVRTIVIIVVVILAIIIFVLTRR